MCLMSDMRALSHVLAKAALRSGVHQPPELATLSDRGEASARVVDDLDAVVRLLQFDDPWALSSAPGPRLNLDGRAATRLERPGVARRRRGTRCGNDQATDMSGGATRS